jgi:hypothetical protein
MPSSAAVSSRPPSITAVHEALGSTRTPALGLDTVQIARVLGVHDKANGGVYQISCAGCEPTGSRSPGGVG